MKAFVKNIPVGTIVTDGMKEEMFTIGMKDYIIGLFRMSRKINDNFCVFLYEKHILIYSLLYLYFHINDKYILVKAIRIKISGQEL